MKLVRKLEEFKIGDDLVPIIKRMTQEKINKYVSAAEDYNPIHVDPEFAKTTPFGSTIAPGFQYIAYISELMAREFGSGWYEAGFLDVRLKRVVRPGDWLTTRAKVVEKEEDQGGKRIVCDVRITNQNGEDVIVGSAGAMCE